jgi:hypothetical protein
LPSCAPNSPWLWPNSAIGLFDGGEVLALDVFNESDFQRLVIGQLTDDNRHIVQPCDLGRPPAAFPGNDFIIFRMAGTGPHQDGLQQAAALDGVRQAVQFSFVEALARLQAAGGQAFYGQA